jgi:hypothetical protein
MDPPDADPMRGSLPSAPSKDICVRISAGRSESKALHSVTDFLSRHFTTRH